MEDDLRLDVCWDIDDSQPIDVWLTQKSEEAEQLAGVPAAGGGCGMGVRDLEFHFETREQMEAAKERLREAGFRFFRGDGLLPSG